MQYNAALAITDATRNNSREKFYRELGIKTIFLILMLSMIILQILFSLQP